MIHDWTRYWTKPDGEISLADQGFLVVPSREHWLAPASGDLWKFEEIAERRCLILLGEPGMGKSSALSAAAVPGNVSGDLVLRVDLGATREESLLQQEIFGSPEFEAWQTGEQELHLFLDSLDEAKLRLGVVEDIILKGLDGVDMGRLRLRLACRTADRLPQFEQKLRGLWAEDESAVHELAPLSRSDVSIAASNRGLTPGDFVAALVERDIVAFAIKPITLEMLLDLAREPDGLPDSQLELYERGLRHLAIEPTERRTRDRATAGGLGAGKRLAVASRIAGATMLSGRTSITLDESARAGRDVATVGQLAGGTECELTTAVPTRFEVSGDVIREVLDTGLFSARGDDLGWAHQTYGEFLAARYLKDSGMSLEQLGSVLTLDDEQGRIVPQLRDLAGWLAMIDPGFAEDLGERDPLVLLRGDVGLAADHQKARLAAALLGKRAADELDRWDPRNRRNLEALAHDGLTALVRPRLTDSDEAESVRELACTLAALCQLEELQADLLRIGLDPGETVELRAAAVGALGVVADTSTRRAVIPVARDPLPEDVDDDLKAAALRAVCPTVVSASQALSWLTPQKNRHLTGAYATFLYRDLPNSLQEDELPVALEWVRRLQPTHDPMDEFARLAEEIVVLGVGAMARDDVRSPLVETIVTYLSDHRELQTFRTRDASDAFTADQSRPRLVKALVQPVREGRLEAVSLVSSTPRLITGRDLPWLVARLSESVGSPDEPVWAELIDYAASYEGADHDLVMDARQASALLYERTRIRYGPVELTSELAARLQQRHRDERGWEEERQRDRAEAPDYDADMDVLLERFEGGDLNAYWQLSINIWAEQGAHHVSLGGSDLTRSPGWRRAPSRRRARIAAAGAQYLRHYVPSDEWFSAERYHPASAGYRALRYLRDHDTEAFHTWGSEAICRWLSAILTFSHDAGEDEEQAFAALLLTIAADTCPGALADAATRLILAEAAHGEGDLFVLHRLRHVLGGTLGPRMLELWTTRELGPKPRAELLRGLLAANVAGAVEAGLANISSGAITTDPDGSRDLAAALLAFADRNVWCQLKPLAEGHPAWGANVFQVLAGDWDRGNDFREALSEEELADLFIWISARFPVGEDPSRFGAHFVGPREQVGEYRDQLLGMLIDRGNDAALGVLDRIEQATGRDLRFVRLRAEESWRVNRWVPPRPEDVVRLAADAQVRVVLSDAHLQRVLVEALARVQKMLGPEGQAPQVWDTFARRPKRETEVGAWVADRLRDDLHGRGIIVNREVEVRVNPRGGIGDRTDIHVDAIASEHVEGARQVTVVIEVKGCWNPELLTAMEDQLAADYLSPTRRHGIYLPVWFDLTGWKDASDQRRAVCQRLDRADLLASLGAQALALRGKGYEITPVLLDASQH